METNAEIFIRYTRQNLHFLEENDITLIAILVEGLSMSEKRKIELALYDCNIEWGLQSAEISKRRIGKRAPSRLK
jgi:hypothetical protein